MGSIPIRHLNTTLKEPDFSGEFIIRNIDDVLDGKDMVQELHRHDFFYVLVLKKGSGAHEIDFLPYTICDHSVFFMRPGQVHQLVLKAESTGYLMQFRDEFYFSQEKVSGQLLRKASHVNHYQFDAWAMEKLHAVLAYILQEYTDKEEKYQEVMKANLEIFLIELIRKHSSSPDPGSLYMQERLENFLELLEVHIFSCKQVSQYAAMLNLSMYQLNAIVKSTLGKTTSELINEHILLEAKRCLLATSNQISQTAYRLGYEDVSYFIRFFKKHTGYSPEAFRHHFR